MEFVKSHYRHCLNLGYGRALLQQRLFWSEAFALTRVFQLLRGLHEIHKRGSELPTTDRRVIPIES